ncbi:MAG: NUDIX hydrolase [Methanomassiliicoccales archaeon]|nr:NUDIX hydrolase [Methanomassiliicoccales archaeon]
MEYEMGFDLVLSARGKRVMDRHKARALRALKEAGDVREAARSLRTTEPRLRKRLGRLRDEHGRSLVSLGRARASLTDEGRMLLETYESRSRFISEQISLRYRNPLLTVDGIIITDEGMVAVRRGREPFKGKLALPGGIVEYGETVEEAVVREVREETGLEALPERLVTIRSRPDRDPRGHFITAVFLMRAIGGKLQSGDDADGVTLVPLDPLPEMAFDHGEIVRDFLAGEGMRKCPPPPNR